MKNTKTKLIAGVGVIGLGSLLLSFGEPGTPEQTRIEVIRSVNGEVTIYDTIVNTSSGFTAEQYLEQLGFAGDENIEILNLPFSHAEMMSGQHHCEMMHGDSMKVVTIEVDENGNHHTTGGGDHMIFMNHPGHVMSDSMKTVEVIIGGPHGNFEGQEGQMIIEKNIMIKKIDSLNNEVVELQQLVELINLDSLMQLHHLGEMDSMTVVMHKIVVEDGEEISEERIEGMKWEEMHGEPTFERHHQNGNVQSDMMIFGGDKDFTIVIVSDASAEPKSGMSIEKTNEPAGGFKVYPNPASKEVTVQLSFDEKATTNITVSNAEGKVVMQMSLGEFSGQHTETINVSKWSKGIYFVNVERPGTKMVEKLVIE